MKVLNLYSGIGGNRKLWQNVDVTAVEQNADIAEVYKSFFPNDKMIIGDAHEYLLKHFAEFDFIWSSPPCPTHSRARFWGSFREDTKPVYPDMILWQEIVFLQHFAKALWVVENVQPYYKDIFNGKKIGRHLFWSNFYIPQINVNEEFKKDSVKALQELHGINLDGYKIQKQKVLRNCVLPEVGLHVFNSAMNIAPSIPKDDLFSEVS